MHVYLFAVVMSSAMQTFSSLDDALDAVDRSSDDCSVVIPVTMKKVYEYENKTNTVVEVESKITKGLLTREQNKESDKSEHSVGLITKAGIPIKLVQFEVPITATIRNITVN